MGATRPTIHFNAQIYNIISNHTSTSKNSSKISPRYARLCPAARRDCSLLPRDSFPCAPQDLSPVPRAICPRAPRDLSPRPARFVSTARAIVPHGPRDLCHVHACDCHPRPARDLCPRAMCHQSATRPEAALSPQAAPPGTQANSLRGGRIYLKRGEADLIRCRTHEVQSESFLWFCVMANDSLKHTVTTEPGQCR